MHFIFFLSSLLFLSTSVFAAPSKYIDLSHDYSEKTLTWPTTEPFHITHTTELTKDFYLIERDYASSEHTGTHMDAPNHFAKNHKGISDISIENLIGPAIKIDVLSQVKSNRDYQISINDFLNWEAKHGKIPAQSIVLLNTGFAQYWPNWELYSGTKEKGEASISQLHFPGLDPKAALWLIQKRHIKAIGIDTFSIDYGQSKQFAAHQTLTQHDIPIFENVADMSKLPFKNFIIYAFPMKIQNGTGAPLRIVASIEKG